jgi:hypothetical protein
MMAHEARGIKGEEKCGSPAFRPSARARRLAGIPEEDKFRPVIPVLPEGEANLNSRAEWPGISNHTPTCGAGLGNTAKPLAGAWAGRARWLMA